MGEVYNIGGSLKSNCSVLEAINLIQEYTKIKINYEIVEKNREGDHIWYISDMRKFKKDYPSWNQKYELADIIKDMI
jgi:CDP-paratose 2-epimerase